ncbi:MAG TPA: alkaline phosphatase family protein [Candidatus Baltobacteraceae bacterium]
MKRGWIVGAVVVALVVACGFWYFRSGKTRPTTVPIPAPALQSKRAARLPRPAHVVVIVEENKSYENIIGNADAPYLNGLLVRAALFTRSYGVAHPSQPNYFALFAGRLNVNGDACAVAGIPASAANLGGELIAAGKSFAGYAEGLPGVGFTGCTSGHYARKHAPWTHFSDIPGTDSRPFSAFPKYAALPTLAFLIPNELDDMHSASIARGDAWLRRNLQPLLDWGARNDALVVVTWDESSNALTNHIPTLFIGPMVRPGRYPEIVSHYTVLRTLAGMYGLTPMGASAAAAPISDVWKATAR